MSGSKGWWVLAIVVVGGVVAWFGLNGGREPAQAADRDAAKDAALSPPVDPGQARGEGAAPRPAKPLGSLHPQAKARSKVERLRVQRRKADELRAKLRALYGAKRAPAPGQEPAQREVRRMPAPIGSGNQAQAAGGKYIQSVVREQFFPVAGSCYEELLQRDPSAAGDIVLALSIVGNADLGGVVESVEVVDEGTTLHDQEFTTCVRESMYTTMFDAPPDDEHSVTVTYPFSFSP